MTKQKTDPKERLLMQALRDAAFDGWTTATLDTAAEKAGVSAGDVFPQGLAELTAYFSHWADDRMAAAAKNGIARTQRIRDKIAVAVMARFDVIAPHKEAFHHIVAASARPRIFATVPHDIYRTCDRIWDLAGDTATDYNRYTKRLILAGVLTATTLYWLRDNSAGHAKTRRFLENRIDNVMQGGKFISRFRKRAA